MRLATWNVNSARARLPRLLAWLEEKQPDVCCLQETKCLDENFPREPIEELGYGIASYGQRTYNGVAILAKRQIEDIVRGFPDEIELDGARILRAVVGDLILVNVYVVNGEFVGSSKYAFKLAWLERLRSYLSSHLDMRERVVVLGDFNITFDDRDVYDPRAWHERIMCSTPERNALRSILDTGLQDSFRKFHEESGHYTWWDFRTRGFERGRGLRIDHLLMSSPALEACTGVEIDTLARAGTRPSDHAPVLAILAG